MPAKKTVETPNEIPEPGHDLAKKPKVKTPTNKGLGAAMYGDAANATELALPLDTQGKTTRAEWGKTAYILALRAKKASQTYGKKDFNALYRLVLSASIAYDKAWPTVQNTLSGNLVVQLFGSLSQDVAKRILEPAHPTITIESVDTKVEATTEQPSPDKPLGSDT